MIFKIKTYIVEIKKINSKRIACIEKDYGNYQLIIVNFNKRNIEKIIKC
jgi:hypothetical protein